MLNGPPRTEKEFENLLMLFAQRIQGAGEEVFGKGTKVLLCGWERSGAAAFQDVRMRLGVLPPLEVRETPEIS